MSDPTSKASTTSTMSIDQAMSLALRYHQAGQLQQAEALYRQVLAANAAHPDALHLLGLIAFQVRRFDLASDLISRAVRLVPNNADYHYNLGQAFSAAGRTADAIASYRRSIAIRSGHAPAWNNLGTALHAIGQHQQAIESLRRALELRPGYAQASYNLGLVYQAVDQLDQAIAAYQRAVELQPDLAEGWNNLGNAFRQDGRHDEAIAAYRKTCQLRPEHAEVHSNLGSLLQEQGQLDEALVELNQSLALAPQSPAAHYNQGNLLRSMERFDEALEAFHRSAALKPDFSDAYNAIGYTLREKREINASVSAYRQALAIDPQNARAHYNLAAALLLQGNLPDGFEEYEWRFKANDPTALALRFKQPTWDGGPLEGRTLLVHAEQGFGDTIHFARYLPMVAQRRGSGGGKIIFQCHPELLRLMGQNLGGADEVRPHPSHIDELPPFDVHCPLVSLPLVFQTTLETIPAQVPYISADKDLSANWCERLKSVAEGAKVGLAWAGRQLKGANRSIPSGSLAPLGSIRGVQLVSLQKFLFEKPTTSLADSTGLDLTDWTEELNDFADTAALIDNLDLVITIDTAVGHLAGAMGKPVWVILPFVPDWRWMLDRSDSPWYPTMRLFRQPSNGDWHPPVQQIVKELQCLK